MELFFDNAPNRDSRFSIVRFESSVSKTREYNCFAFDLFFKFFVPNHQPNFTRRSSTSHSVSDHRLTRISHTAVSCSRRISLKLKLIISIATWIKNSLSNQFENQIKTEKKRMFAIEKSHFSNVLCILKKLKMFV